MTFVATRRRRRLNLIVVSRCRRMTEDDGGNIYHRQYRRLTSAFGYPPLAIRRFNSIFAVLLLPRRTIALSVEHHRTSPTPLSAIVHLHP